MRVLPMVILAAFGSAGCLPAVPTEHGPTSGDETQGNPSPSTPTSPGSPAPSGPTAPQTCGAQTFSITTAAVPPNVFFLVDRSGSMSDDFGGAASGTKWDAAQTALNGVLNGNVGKAQWGLSLFPPNPSQDTCGTAQIDVPLTMGDEATILSKINALTNTILANPRGSTPTDAAFKSIAANAALTATDRNNYVVLMTDGLPNCSNASDVGAQIDALYNRTPSVKTFVVGVGADTASNPTLLNQWAEKGHTARTGQATEYYQANDATQLIMAFDAVIGATTSCTYKLQAPPADPTLVVGQLDGMSIPSDPVNGFTYDATNNAVVFHGTSCDSITSGKVKNVNVEYGCPPTTVL